MTIEVSITRVHHVLYINSGALHMSIRPHIAKSLEPSSLLYRSSMLHFEALSVNWLGSVMSYTLLL